MENATTVVAMAIASRIVKSWTGRWLRFAPKRATPRKVGKGAVADTMVGEAVAIMVEEARVEVGAVIHGERAEIMATGAKREDGEIGAVRTAGVAEERMEGRVRLKVGTQVKEEGCWQRFKVCVVA